MAFFRRLAEEIGVAVVPDSCFFYEPINHLIRFHFAKIMSILLILSNKKGNSYTIQLIIFKNKSLTEADK